ncbi:putative disease resistance protein At1g50180 [Silene latifolia]|uniref:putative disease resistance protein At1g50180 n=1 Tax=Silene latifolia TaxID=37657 RepID=UPI003D77AAC2
MADVKSAAQLIARLLVEEAKYLAKVRENVKELQDELEWMQCFLRSADASQLDSSMARKWVAQIREFAYEAEDTVEKFIVNIRGGGHGYVSMLKKYSMMFWKVIAVHQVGKKIDALKNKMSFLTTKLNTYGIKFESGDNSLLWLLKAKHESYFTCKKEPLIGRDTDVTELLKLLVPAEVNKVDSSTPSSSKTDQFPIIDSKTESRIVSIWGVGGIGKTIVAKEIFYNHEIRRSYQAFAWASISQPCQISAVQQELLSGLTSKSREQIAQMTDCELKHQLCKVQRRKRCFIVLDGLWKAELWDQLKEAFPITSCNFKSTIMLTTRIEGIAKYVHHQSVNHELLYLDAKHSKLLLEEKIGNSLAGMPDADRQKIGLLKEKMLKHSGNLPLAIVVLGGVLATKRTLEEWETVEKKLSLYPIDKQDQPWEKILDLSYYELPYQLKPCLLYMGYFPTNLEITTTKLGRLWEAEGIVSSGDDEDSEETLEDVAEGCLAELVERSLVQVASRDLEGRAKTCRLHDVMRKLCMDKALKLNWLSIAQLDEKSDQSAGTTTRFMKSSRSINKKKSRRLAIYCTEKLDNLLSDYKKARYVRSLLFFNTLETDKVLIPLKNKALKSAIHHYKFLRVLDIENTGLHTLPKDVGSLIHLRYLSLRGSWVSKLPYSIKHLRCLQTLDLRVLSFVCMRIPDVLSRLERLVHLYLPSKAFILRNKAPKLQLKGLVNLETLSNFSHMCKAEDVSTLTNLREFSSCDYLSCLESIAPLLQSPSSALVHLDYISLRLEGDFLSANPSLDKCKALHKLWVKGNISQTISSIKFPDNLNKLSLSGSGFMEDPMPILEKLPHLKHLSLENGSYNGESMKCSKGGFQELCYLNVEGLEKLEDWTVEVEAMPDLCTLEINGCPKLVKIPEGLRDVKSLQELIISYMPLSFYRGWTPLKSLTDWKEYSKVEHVPRVDILKILDIQKD